MGIRRKLASCCSRFLIICCRISQIRFVAVPTIEFPPLALPVEGKLPAIFQWPETAEEGGLLGYGPSFVDIFRQRASVVAKILRGTKLSEVPVEQPSTFKLAVNLKTAKAMNFNLPSGLLLRADKIIE